MNKKSLSESDICDRFISPALTSAGWDETRWRREYPFTAGRIIVRGELIARGKQKRADYLDQFGYLFHRSRFTFRY
jgi:type I restriction enzyme R subunit